MAFMKSRIIIVVLFVVTFLSGYSQSESRDSLAYVPMDVDSLRLKPNFEKPDSLRAFEYTPQDINSGFLIENLQQIPDNSSDDLTVPALNFRPGEPSLFRWGTGEITVAGGSAAYPGLMQIDSGSVGINQSFGNFGVYLGGNANKYGWFRGLDTQYGINGSLRYKFSPRFYATVYGEYYFGSSPVMANGMPMPPSMLGYYGYNNFGGYFDYDINEHFGIQFGGQMVRPTYEKRYEFEPIATPYFKIGKKKVRVGIPVGQILYHLIRK